MKKVILLGVIVFLAALGFIYVSQLYKSKIETADSQKSEPKIKISKASERHLGPNENIIAISIKDESSIVAAFEPKPDIVRFGFNPEGTLQMLDRYERTGWGFNDITFIDSVIGFATGGYGTFFKTEDGGNTWNQMPQVSEFDLTEVKFLNQLTGYVAGKFGIRNKKTGDDEWEVGIWKTNDGGNTWGKVYSAKDERYVFQMSVLSSEIALASLDGERLIRTTDGGRTWDRIPTQNKKVTSLTFGPDESGWLLGSDGNFLKSTDKGATWQDVASASRELFNHEWWSIDIGKTGNGLAVSEDGTVLFTTDGGSHWKRHSQRIADNLRKAAVCEDVGIILGSQSVFKVDFVATSN